MEMFGEHTTKLQIFSFQLNPDGYQVSGIKYQVKIHESRLTIHDSVAVVILLLTTLSKLHPFESSILRIFNLPASA